MTCLIFDSDGTLVDSELLNCQTMAVELAVSGIVVEAEKLVSDFRGWQLDALLSHLQREQNVCLDAGFVNRFRDRAFEVFKTELQPVEHIAGVLQELNHPMCVASNGPIEKLQLALGVTGLEHFFTDKMFSAYEVGSSKPEPGLFLYAAKKMGVVAEQCIVIEDSTVGIEAAKAAGMPSVFYNKACGTTPAANITAQPGKVNAPVKTIQDMRDLPQAITELQNQ